MPAANADASSSGASSSTQTVPLQTLTPSGTTQTNQTGQTSSTSVGNAPNAANSGLPPTSNVVQATVHIAPLWKRTFNWFKDPKSDAQAIALVITVTVGVLGLMISIASIIVPSVQGAKSLIQGREGLTQAEINNDYLRLVWCQALPEERFEKISWCAHHQTPGTFDDQMRNDRQRRDEVDVSKYSALLSPGNRAAFKKHLLASGFSDDSLASTAAIESAIEFLHSMHVKRDMVNDTEVRRTPSLSISVLSRMNHVFAPCLLLTMIKDLQPLSEEPTYTLEFLISTIGFNVFGAFLGYDIASSRGLEWRSASTFTAKWQESAFIAMLDLAQVLLTSQSYFRIHHKDGRLRYYMASILNLYLCVTVTVLAISGEDEIFTWSHLAIAWSPLIVSILVERSMFVMILQGYFPFLASPVEPHEGPNLFGTFQPTNDLRDAGNYRLVSYQQNQQTPSGFRQSIATEVGPDKQKPVRVNLKTTEIQDGRLFVERERVEEKARRRKPVAPQPIDWTLSGIDPKVSR